MNLKYGHSILWVVSVLEFSKLHGYMPQNAYCTWEYDNNEILNAPVIDCKSTTDTPIRRLIALSSKKRVACRVTRSNGNRRVSINFWHRQRRSV